MIDYDELTKELERMKPRQRLYELIKLEMVKRGRWKIAGRGRPFKSGKDIRRV